MNGHEAAQTELQLLQALRERDELFLIVAEESTARADAECTVDKLQSELASLRDALRQSAAGRGGVGGTLQDLTRQLQQAREEHGRALAQAEQRAQAQADLDRDRLLQELELDRRALEVRLSDREFECRSARSTCKELEDKVAQLSQQLAQAPAAYHQDVHIKALVSRIAELESQLQRAREEQAVVAAASGQDSIRSVGGIAMPSTASSTLWSPPAAESDQAQLLHMSEAHVQAVHEADLSLPLSLETLPELIQAQDYVALHSHASALEAHCAELEAHCHVLTDDVQHAGASLQLLQQQLETSQAEASALRDTIRSLEEQLESGQSRVNDLLHAHGAEAEALEEHARATELALREVESERDSIRQQLAQAARSARDTEKEKERVEGRLHEAEEQVEKLQAQLTAFDRQLVAAARSPVALPRQPSPPSSLVDNAAVLQAQAEAQRLQAQLSAERARSEDLQRQLDNAGVHSELTAALARDLSVQLDEEMQRRREAEEAREHAENSSSASSKQMEGLQTQLAERDTLVTALQDTVMAQQARIAELEAICAAADVAPHVSPSKSPLRSSTPALPIMAQDARSINDAALAASELVSSVSAASSGTPAIGLAPLSVPVTSAHDLGHGQSGTGFESLEGAATPQDVGESLSYPTARAFVQYLRSIGLRKAQLILGIDCTKSNLWNGKDTFRGRPLHDVSDPVDLNPYQAVMSVFGRMLTGFDHDGMIPLYGFGCERTRDLYVFPFRQFDPLMSTAAAGTDTGDAAPESTRSESIASASSSSISDSRAVDVYCAGLDEVLATYARVIPSVPLAGPTSFAPLIRKAMEHVKKEKEKCLTVLVIIAGKVSPTCLPSSLCRLMHRPVGSIPLTCCAPCFADGQVTAVKETETAIVEASRYPLSIICVGVGDGPWTDMNRFDDGLPQRKVDNFQFVEFAAVQKEAREVSRYPCRALIWGWLT